MDYSTLLKNIPRLQPIEVSIEGLEFGISVHLFTVDEMEKVFAGVDVAQYESDLKAAADDEAKNALAIAYNEKMFRVQTLRFLGGVDADVSEPARNKLSGVFASWQLRQLYQKALKANGYGPESVREAVKNSERTLG